MLISKDWSRAKQLQVKAEKAAKFLEEKKKIIWNFVPQNKNKESYDQVNFELSSVVLSVGIDLLLYYGTYFISSDKYASIFIHTDVDIKCIL